MPFLAYLIPPPQKKRTSLPHSRDHSCAIMESLLVELNPDSGPLPHSLPSSIPARPGTPLPPLLLLTLGLLELSQESRLGLVLLDCEHHR